MYIAVKIHNNSLGTVKHAENEDAAKDIVRDWAEKQFERGLTDEEIESLDNELEIYNEDDPDNLWCFSVGIVE